MKPEVTLVECPRDAMQGLHTFIPTQTKIAYLNALLQVGFDVLDFGSFVSPKAVPQLADTAEVLAGLNLADTRTQLLAIIANVRGAEEALKHPAIQYLGFPFSVSETFQQRNTNKSQEEARKEIEVIQGLCLAAERELVVYLSMGFGNPYGDAWSEALLVQWAHRLADLDIRTLSLADTVGSAEPGAISRVFTEVIHARPEINFGAHFHAHPARWREKVDAAWQAGCRRYDGALRGYGGCPFAADELVGNIATENLVQYAHELNLPLALDEANLQAALVQAGQVFPAE